MILDGYSERAVGAKDRSVPAEDFQQLGDTIESLQFVDVPAREEECVCVRRCFSKESYSTLLEHCKCDHFD